jgi:hypothetical protein
LDSTLRLPRPQRVTQRIDAEVSGGGLGAEGGQLSEFLVARASSANAGQDTAALDDQF